MASDIHVFDRAAYRRHRERAASGDGSALFLLREARERLIDRVADTTYRFARVLDLGSGEGGLITRLAEIGKPADLVIGLDPAPGFAGRSRPSIVADEELLPFAAGSFDLVVSALTLHWTNDLPGALVQIRRALRPDGLFVACMFGGETLFELREALTLAELELRGGAAARVSPVADLPDLSGLMQRAGFALPVIDSDIFTASYPHLVALMADLRAMGETGALVERPRGLTPRTLFARAAQIYQERFGDAEGRIPASFRIITLTGWAPADTQPRALRPGSAAMRLADALGTREVSTGVPAAPKKG